MNEYRPGQTLTPNDIKEIATNLTFTGHGYTRFKERAPHIESLLQIKELVSTSRVAFRGSENDYVIALSKHHVQFIISDEYRIITVMSMTDMEVMRLWGASSANSRNVSTMHKKRRK